MGNREIRELFFETERQFAIQDEKKRQTLAAVTAEMKKRKAAVIPKREILFSQFLYMDKSFLYVYPAFVCVWIGALFLLQRTGMDVNAMIPACMIGASFFAVITVLFIDELFLGRMAELGASCYFHTKQCVAVYMVFAGSVNLVGLLLLVIYAGSCWGIGTLQLGLYVLTAFFLSNLVSVGILSTDLGRENRYGLFVGGAFQAAGYAALSAVPGAFYGALLGVWAAACAIVGALLALQLKRLFSQMERGDVLCMN